MDPRAKKGAQTRKYKVPFVLSQSVYRWTKRGTIGILGFDSRLGMGIFPFTTVSRTALGPTQLPIQWVPGALYWG
jgi:hypothetical protein